MQLHQTQALPKISPVPSQAAQGAGSIDLMMPLPPQVEHTDSVRCLGGTMTSISQPKDWGCPSAIGSSGPQAFICHYVYGTVPNGKGRQIGWAENM